MNKKHESVSAVEGSAAAKLINSSETYVCRRRRRSPRSMNYYYYYCEDLNCDSAPRVACMRTWNADVHVSSAAARRPWQIRGCGFQIILKWLLIASRLETFGGKDFCAHYHSISLAHQKEAHLNYTPADDAPILAYVLNWFAQREEKEWAVEWKKLEC